MCVYTCIIIYLDMYKYYYDVMYSIQSTTNTFQGILISDGSSSYAVFIYDCSNMEWGGGVIGWQQSTTQYASHDNSDDRDSNEAVCRYQTSSFTTLVYRVDSGKPFLCIALSLPLISTSEFLTHSLPTPLPTSQLYTCTVCCVGVR